MGRRARARAADDQGAAAPAPAPKARPATGSALTPERRLVAAFLGGAALIGLLTLIGIATLGGTAGPLIVLAVVVLLTTGLLRFGRQRLDGIALTEEDRLMRLLAAGVAVMAVVLAAINVVVSLVTRL